MITNQFINLLALFLQGFILILPDSDLYSLPGQFSDISSYVGSRMMIYNPLFPISEIFTVVLLSLTVASGVVIAKVSMFIINYFRGR